MQSLSSSLFNGTKSMVIDGQGHSLNQGQRSFFMYFPCIYTIYFALNSTYYNCIV